MKKFLLLVLLYVMLTLNAHSQCNITVTMANTHSYCYCTFFGSATANPLNGTPPYHYQWSNGDTNQTTVGCPGTYIVTITDSSNCPAIVDSTFISSVYPSICLYTLPASCDTCCDGSAHICGINDLSCSYSLSWTGCTDVINPGTCISICAHTFVSVTAYTVLPCCTGYSDSVEVMTGTTEVKPIPKIEIFPNPTTSELRIKNAELRIESIEVYSTFGERLLSQKPIANSQEQIIDISLLEAGIYFVRLKTESGIVTKKFIKQ